MLKFVVIGALMSSLVGCQLAATPVEPKTPAQTVYQAKAIFAASLVIADQYAVLPTCPVQSPICKTADVLAVVQWSAHVTKDSLDAAQVIVDDPNWPNDKILATANAALSAATAFQTVTADLQTH